VAREISNDKLRVAQENKNKYDVKSDNKDNKPKKKK
jgi:hypothetical protein